MTSTETCTAFPPLRHRSLLRRAMTWLIDADARHRQDHALRNLPDHLRRDVGLLPQGDWTPPAILRHSDPY